MELERYRIYSEIARGIRKPFLVFKNANVFMAHSGEFCKGDVAVEDGIVIGVGEYEGETEIDLDGKYLCPGFIDSHLHLESTLVTPGELIRQAAQCGTTTFIVDPHESANVSGTDGINYILEQTEEVPANVYVMMPSCVPATHVDDNGCTLTAGKMKAYLNNPRILGLGEVMDAPSVVNGSVSMHEKLSVFKDRVRDGHAPFLPPGDLAAYALAGISTDHECVTYEYAMEECRNGMQVLIREGSAAKNLEAIVKGIVEHHTDTSGFCFCTDDKHIEEIRKEGHINFNVKKAVQLGLRPEQALKMATIQAAKCYGLNHLGAIAPGYQADFVVMDNLSDMNVLEVYHKGKKIIKDEKVEIRPCATSKSLNPSIKEKKIPPVNELYRRDLLSYYIRCESETAYFSSSAVSSSGATVSGTAPLWTATTVSTTASGSSLMSMSLSFAMLRSLIRMVSPTLSPDTSTSTLSTSADG